MTAENILSRNNTIWMQGVSALLIMLMHFVMQIDGYPRFFNIFGSVAVAVFLFISGFGINESYKKNKLSSFWKKRFLRVIIPCWIVFLIQLIFIPHFSINRLIHNLLFIDSDLWFVDYILRWYLVYWCCRKFLPNKTLYILLIYGIYNIFQQQLYSEQAFSFFAGFLVSEHYHTIKKQSRKNILRYTSAMVTYGIIFLLLKEIPCIQGIKGSFIFNIILLNIKLPLAMGIIVMPYLLPRVNNHIFAFFGHISYELYIVHYNFMPYVENIVDIAEYSCISIIISYIFMKFNQLSKNRNTFVYYFTAILYIGICCLLTCKYSMRATNLYGYICMAYVTILIALLIGFNTKNILNNKQARFISYAILGIFVLSLLIVQYHFDPLQNRVDRWSAIAYPLEYLFSGKFPYLAETHLGGNASPFPMWMFFHIPFYLLGNVGLSEIFTCLLFLYSIKLLYGYHAAIKSSLLLFLCTNLWYEVSVRSDLISNFFLLAAFINLLIAYHKNIETQTWILSIAAGLWLSTRLSVAFPLFILFFPAYSKMTLKKQILIPSIVLVTFALTFVPLALWDAKDLFGAENNPFSLQFRQGNPAATIILVVAALIMSLSWKKNNTLLYFYCATILALIPIISYGFTLYKLNNWTEFFGPIYDLTYLDASIPFCISAFADMWNRNSLYYKEI